MLKDRFYEEIGLFLQLRDELKEIHDLELINDNPITFKFTLEIKNNKYNFELVICNCFPYQPIIIRSLDSTWRSKHQYRDNTMCLKWGIDNWHENLTVKDLILNLIELLEVENPLGDEHGVADDGDSFSTFQQVGRNKGTSVFYSKSSFDKIENEGEGFLQLREIDDKSIAFVESVDKQIIYNKLINEYFKKVSFIYKRFDEDYNINTLFNSDIFKQNFGTVIVGVFNDKIEGILRTKPFKTKDELLKFIKENGITGITDEKLNNYENTFFYQIYSFIEIEKELFKRVPLTEEIKNKKISIIGMGSIGSRIFIDLCRAGFEQFCIVDDDVFMPYNIVRHELTFKYVGYPKVFALKEYVEKEINSEANIIPYTFAINGQESAKRVEELLYILKQSDIIIDCTADSNLIFSINEIVKKYDINYISGAVISGGIGNIMTKRCKGSKLSIVDLLESQKKFFELNGLDKLLQPDYSVSYGDNQYVASMSDCSILAGLIGKNVINILQNNNEFAESDIYVMSTSNSFIGEAYTTYPIIGNKRKYRKRRLNKNLVERGRNYYIDYSKKNKQ